MGPVRRAWRRQRLLALLLPVGLWCVQAGAGEAVRGAEPTPASASAPLPQAAQSRPLAVIPAGALPGSPSTGAFEVAALSAPAEVAPLPDSGFDTEMLKTFNAMVDAIRAVGRHCGSAGYFGAAGPVRYDERLARASLAHVVDMIERDYFSHATLRSPRHPRGLKLMDRVSGAGYPVGQGATRTGMAAAEVLGRGHRSFSQILEAWLASPSHCAALMEPSWREFGVAARFRADRVPLWDMLLARPPR